MDLKRIVRRCGFDNEDRMVRDRIVLGTNDKRLQKKLLDTHELTMEMAVDLARSAELSNQQVARMQGSSEVVDLVRKNPGKGGTEAQRSEPNHHKECKKGNINCKFCGRTHLRGKCPAFGKFCNNCRGTNHFASVCKKKSVKEIKLENKNENETYLYLDTIKSLNY
ncbi:uncharacterized protein LOC118757007 [Rhagoletis pomonella]|nr:uncharacterized protein LOC118757007 [Rhagoletis pomonella]